MLKVSFTTSRKRDDILNEAESFFNKNGLSTTEKGDCCLTMEGGGGYVRVDVVENEKNEVTVETREWDYQVKQFAANHGK